MWPLVLLANRARLEIAGVHRVCGDCSRSSFLLGDVLFCRYGYGEPTVAAQWGLPALALVMAATSYALVERPIRRVRLAPIRAIAWDTSCRLR